MFADSIQVIVKLSDADQESIANLLTKQIKLQYAQDSTFYQDENGYLTKIPDDTAESAEPSNNQFSNQEDFYNYMKRYGLVPTNQNNEYQARFIVCKVSEVTVTDDDGHDKVVYTFNCDRK
ncbi:hypothetical protein ACOYR1_11655 [Thalassotalea piscium]